MISRYEYNATDEEFEKVVTIKQLWCKSEDVIPLERFKEDISSVVSFGVNDIELHRKINEICNKYNIPI